MTFKDTHSSNNNLSVGKEVGTTEKKLNQVYGLAGAEPGTDNKNE